MLFEDIQKEIIRGYKTGERIGFREAVMNLRRCGSVNRGEIEIPDFFKWNVWNLQEFRRLVAKIPVPTSRIISVVPNYKDTENEVIFPGTVPVQIIIGFK